MIKIRYIDSFCNSFMHVQFNSSLLVMCSLISDEVYYISGKYNGRNVFNLIEKYKLDNIRKDIIYVNENNSRIFLLIRYLTSAFQNIRFLIISPYNEILIFNYNNLFAVRLMNFLNKIIRKRILIFCHGEMEFLLPNLQSGGLLHKLQVKLANNFFLNKRIRISKNLHFVVMGDSIYSNLKSILPHEKIIKFFKIDHSYIFGETFKCNQSSSILNLGTVGAFSKLKGADLLVHLSEILNVKEASNVEICIIGRVFYDVKKLSDLGIKLPLNKGLLPLDYDEFNDRISELDFILFLYPASSYRLIASGAIMDALNMKKPIIAIKNDYFEYIFNKFGQFGYLVENIEDMANLIKELSSDKFISLDIDFDSIRNKLSPNILKDILNETITKITNPKCK